jgi:penicillin-binding protein 1A
VTVRFAKNRSTPKQKKTKTRIWQWTHVHLSFYLFFICGLVTFFIGALLFVFVALNIPDVSSLESYRPPQATLIIDSQGKEIDRIFTRNRRLISLNEMPDLLPKAFIAAEDDRFYQHPGVDSWSILRAIIYNVRKGGRKQGGSTITQQVARSLVLTPEKTYTR